MAAERLGGRQRGISMIEMIVVIVITGVLAAGVATFIRVPVNAYYDTLRRAQLTDTADTALRRIGRDVRTALPNSLRPASAPAAGTACFEFLPTLAGGRYRAAPKTGGGGDVLDFSSADGSFEVLADVNLAVAAAGNRVAIYNLGISSADAYANDTTALLGAVGGGGTSVTLSAAKQFPFESPGRRFHVIPDAATVFVCSGVGSAAGNGTGSLLRGTQAINATPMSTCPALAGAALLAANVSACSFNYNPGATARAGLLSLRLDLQQGGETVSLIQEVHVDNVP